MIFNFEELINKYTIKIQGIIHIGGITARNMIYIKILIFQFYFLNL
jgi:hypothetical protein